jgi:hypothetical protein
MVDFGSECVDTKTKLPDITAHYELSRNLALGKDKLALCPRQFIARKASTVPTVLRKVVY